MNVSTSLLSTLDTCTARFARFSAAWWRILLAGLLAYQVVIYGWVSRAYMHVSVVLYPWLINQPEYLLYDNISIGYAPGHLWLTAALSQLIPDTPLRLRRNDSGCSHHHNFGFRAGASMVNLQIALLAAAFTRFGDR